MMVKNFLDFRFVATTLFGVPSGMIVGGIPLVRAPDRGLVGNVFNDTLLAEFDLIRPGEAEDYDDVCYDSRYLGVPKVEGFNID